jgi:hypothetical protein
VGAPDVAASVCHGDEAANGWGGGARPPGRAGVELGGLKGERKGELPLGELLGEGEKEVDVADVLGSLARGKFGMLIGAPDRRRIGVVAGAGEEPFPFSFDPEADADADAVAVAVALSLLDDDGKLKLKEEERGTRSLSPIARPVFPSEASRSSSACSTSISASIEVNLAALFR